jgi:hypothetical protein
MDNIERSFGYTFLTKMSLKVYHKANNKICCHSEGAIATEESL